MIGPQDAKHNFNDGEDFRDVNIWFQQDCSTARTARQSMEVVREMLPRRLSRVRVGGLLVP